MTCLLPLPTQLTVQHNRTFPLDGCDQDEALSLLPIRNTPPHTGRCRVQAFLILSNSKLKSVNYCECNKRMHTLFLHPVPLIGYKYTPSMRSWGPSLPHINLLIRQRIYEDRGKLRRSEAITPPNYLYSGSEILIFLG